MPPAALYDTSVVIDVEKVDLGVYLDGAVVVSAVTLGELAYGIGTGDRDARELRLRRVLASYEIVPFGVEEAKFYGVLAELVRIAGRNPRPRRLDLQIAATAAAARLPLLTMNPDDFVGVGTLVDVVPIRHAGPADVAPLPRRGAPLAHPAPAAARAGWVQPARSRVGHAVAPWRHGGACCGRRRRPGSSC